MFNVKIKVRTQHKMSEQIFFDPIKKVSFKKNHHYLGIGTKQCNAFERKFVIEIITYQIRSYSITSYVKNDDT